MREDIHTAAGYSGKLPVIITSYSVCDLPDSIIRKLRIPVIPALIRTDEGVFKDGVQMDAGELIRHIDAGKNAVSFSGDEAAYTEFFAEALKKAHHLIHISVTSSMSDDYKMACEAAKAFDNVTVINSGCLSSATGLLVLIAVKLAQQNMPVDQIIAELEAIKPRLKCSFVVDTTQYMAKKGFVSPLVHKAAQALNLHPALRFRDDKGEIGGIWLGSTKRAYRRYIHKAFPVDVIPDSDVAFVTYVDMPTETLLWIREEIRRVAYFEHVVFEQASAAISSNCGPGTFGILYFVKGNKSYNIGSFFQETEEGTNEKDEGTERTEQPVQKEETAPDQPWYRKIEGINWEVALKNSGSEEALRTVVQIFYDSIPEKTEELNRYYGSEDWENYTIKVHALKSSAKLIGALLLSEKAQKLENAGKEKDVSYIREHHEAFMQDYGKYTALFAPEFGGRSEKEKPVADDALMESVYEGLREAAEAMDCGQLDDILAELEEYGIPESEQERFADISAKAKNYDYEGILQALQKKG